MNQKKKYQYFTAALFLVFIYLTGTEVLDRWSTSLQLYNEMRAKEELNPEKLAMKKMELRARRQQLMTALTRNSGNYDQSETGVFEYLNSCAHEASVKFESLVPAESESTSQLREIGFKIGISNDFHHVGTFVNTIENGTLSARIRKIEIQSRSKSGSPVSATIEGSVSILPKKR
ncbi:MAG: type 4a pilus biogenesis protein PilO [Bacteroidota bacterium]